MAAAWGQAWGRWAAAAEEHDGDADGADGRAAARVSACQWEVEGDGHADGGNGVGGDANASSAPTATNSSI